MFGFVLHSCMNNRLPTAIPHKMPVRFVVTGFSQFRGVTDNPTEKIVQDLDGYIQQRGGIKGMSRLCKWAFAAFGFI